MNVYDGSSVNSLAMIMLSKSSLLVHPPTAPGLEPSTVHKCPLSTVGGQLPPGQWNTSVLMPAFAVTLKIGSAVKNADENASMVISL